MVEYSVMLRRHRGDTRPDVCIYSSENREAALREMRRYVRQEGFTVTDYDGRYTVRNVTLVEKEPIAGAPVLSETSYIELFPND